MKKGVDINMLKCKIIIPIFIFATVFLLALAGCGEPGDPDPHFGPVEEEENMNE